MREIQVLVSDDELESVTDALDEEGVEYVRQRAWLGGEEQWLFTLPVPTDAIGHLLGRMEEAGVDVDQYTVITSVESARTAATESLMRRFANDFDPLTRPEIRSKARDMSRDPRSFLALITLAALIATAGLLAESFAVVVGSMVIAPIVGPVLTAAVGAITGDRDMLVESVWLQAAGLGLAIVGAAVFGLGLRASGFVPGVLDLTTLDLIAVRIAPGLLSVAVALAAGGAAAFGLATKGPTSVIGVMIAAALIPAAATVGIAAAWAEPRVAVGALVLLLLSIVLINVGAYATLSRLGYGTGEAWWRRPSASGHRRVAVVGTVVVVLVVVLALVAGSYQQVAYERTVNQEVEAVLTAPEYASVTPVAVRIEYAGLGLLPSAETVTVIATRTANGEPPSVAGVIATRIREATGDEVAVRVQFLEYQRSNGTEAARLAVTRSVERRVTPVRRSRPRWPGPGGTGVGSRPDRPIEPGRG